MGLAAGVQAVQRAGAVTLVERHSAGPEAAGRIALAVVHPLIGPIGFDVGNHRQALCDRIEPGETIVHGQHKIAVFGRRNRAHHAADLEGLEGAGGRVEPVDASTQDIHEPETRGAGVPDRPLTELGLVVEHQFGIMDGNHQTRIARGDATASGAYRRSNPSPIAARRTRSRDSASTVDSRCCPLG